MKQIRLLPGAVVALAATLALAACSSDGSTTEAAATSTGTAGAGAEATPSAADDPTPSEPPATPPISSGRHEAGALSAQLHACDIRGTEFTASSSSEAIPGLAAYDGHLYVLDAEGRVHRFTPSLGASCTLDLDTSWAEDGTYTPRVSDVSSISIAESGRMALSGGVFGLEVVDLSTMTSVECSGAGQFLLAADGRTGLGHFPGSPLKELTVNDTNCEVTDSALDEALPFGSGTVQALAWDGKRLLAGGPDADETTKLARIGANGKVEWLKGGESDDARFGWVHGLAACGPGVCSIDTNYKRMQLRDADGAWLTSIDLNEVLQVSGSAWWTDLEPAMRGGVWLSMGVTPTGASEAKGAIALAAFPD